MSTKSGLGLSPLTGRVYWGRSNGTSWIGEKRDVTSEFVQIVLQKFGPDTPEQQGMRSEITVDGKPAFEIIVRRLPVPDAQDHNGEGALAKNGRKASEEELAAFEEWLHRTCPSGDVEQVQRAWEESSEYADLQAPGQRGEG